MCVYILIFFFFPLTGGNGLLYEFDEFWSVSAPLPPCMWISCTGSCWLWLFCRTIPLAQCFISLSLPPCLPLSLSSSHPPLQSLHSHFLPEHFPSFISALLLCVHPSLLSPLMQLDAEVVQEGTREFYVSASYNLALPRKAKWDKSAHFGWLDRLCIV